MAFQGVGERNGAPENIAQQQKRLRLVNVRPILLGCYAELRLGRDVPKRKPDNSDRVSRKEKSTSSTREGIALGHNSAHHISVALRLVIPVVPIPVSRPMSLLPTWLTASIVAI
jgi:hypothetical protein